MTAQTASGSGESAVADVDAVVVGAGMAGLYLLHRLRQAGFSTRVLEAADDVGGTWYWNRYPGARCDVQSLDYSYSFDPDLEAEWEWSEKYATQPEILRYLQHVADSWICGATSSFRLGSKRRSGTRRRRCGGCAPTAESRSPAATS